MSNLTIVYDKPDDATVEFMITLYWLVDICGSIVGLFSNALLILATVKTSGKQMQSYSYLFLITAIFDLFFSFIELLTQHQLVVRNGVLFILPHGFEPYLPLSWMWILIIPHGFVTMHGLFILGAQYKYRHDLITKPGTSLKDLLKAISMTAPCGLFTGMSLALSVYESKQRGDDYYRSLMNGPWFSGNARRYFLYACDIRDLGGKGFFYGGLAISSFWVNFSIYFTYRAWKHVNKHKVELSERTKALQRQFTISLIIQTINACLFAVIPVLLVCISIIFHLEADFLGAGTMAPLSWLPAANAVLTMYVVKAYRSYVKSFFGFKSSTIGSSTATTMVEKQSSKTITEQTTTPQASIKYVTQPADLPNQNDYPEFH